MAQIKIEVTGVTYQEARELALLLRDIEGVESARVPWKTQDHAFDPNTATVLIPELRASADAHALILVLKGIVEGIAAEVGKDAYAHLKTTILRRIGEWREAKEPEQRKRIVFLFDDEHMLVNRGEAEKS